jgi:hypothetical protein
MSVMTLRRRAVTAAAAALILLPLAGCGEDEPAASAAGGVDPGRAISHITLAEAGSLLDDRLAVVRTGRGRAALAGEVDPRPVESARYETQDGEEFDLLVFATPAAARAAMPSIARTEVVRGDGAAARAVNVVAAFDERPDRGSLRAVWDELRELRDACAGPPPERPEPCAGRDGGVPPAGDGAAADSARIGATVTVGDFGYTPAIARQLNPRIVPDREIVGARRPRDGRTFLGVFVRVCNQGDAAARPSDRIALLDAFGERVLPVELPASNAFAYTPRRVEPGDCLPPTGSVADRAADGALLLFEIPYAMFDERPLALEVVGPSGERRSVLLDL